MADTKISGLPASTTPLAGTEVLPIVQSGVTKQVSVANLTAARSVSGLNFVANAGQTTFKSGGFFDDPVLGNDGGVLIGGGPSFLPTNGSGIGTNGAMNLGRNDLRFNNLYLAGNVIVESGQGIDFSATPGTGTSELLADYEEGTYTAVLTPQTSGTIPLNSSFDELAYTKVGRLVTVTGQIQTFNPSLPVGAFFTLNLPFTPADLTELAGRGGFMLNYQNTAVSANWEEGVASIYVNKNASTVLTGENLFLSFSYFAA